MDSWLEISVSLPFIRGPLSDSFYVTSFLAAGLRVPDAGYHG